MTAYKKIVKGIPTTPEPVVKKTCRLKLLIPFLNLLMFIKKIFDKLAFENVG